MTSESIANLAAVLSPPSTACEPLDWDTRFFGRHIARVAGHRLGEEMVAELLRSVREESIDCLYFLADPERPTTLLVERHGFQLVDVRVTLAARLMKTYAGAGCGEAVRKASRMQLWYHFWPAFEQRAY